MVQLPKTSPSEIVFKNVLPHKTYEVNCKVFYQHSRPHKLRLVGPDKEHFSVLKPWHKNIFSRHTAKYRVVFKPKEKTNYICSLTYKIGSKSFAIPISGFQQVPVLDLSEDTNMIRQYGSVSEPDVHLTETTLTVDEENICEKYIEIEYKGVTNVEYIWKKFSNKEENEANFLLDDEGVTVSPKMGQITPGGTVRTTITVTPQKCPNYKQALCLDIKGKEALLPVHIWVECLRPRLYLSHDVVTVGNVVLNTHQTYELTLSNQGFTQAPFQLVPSHPSSKQSFKISASEGTVPPGQKQVLTVTFSAQKLGCFKETLSLEVEGMLDRPCVTFRGRVMCNPFAIDVAELDFGDVCEGSVTYKTFNMRNRCAVPINYGIRLLGSVRMQTFRVEQRQEDDLFVVMPCEETMDTGETCEIMVSLCSPTVKRHKRLLTFHCVLADGEMGPQVASLRVKARCISPDVQLSATSLSFAAYVKERHEEDIFIRNKSNTLVPYQLLEQDKNRSCLLRYHSPRARGLIAPYGNVLLPINLRAETTGTLETIASVLFGSKMQVKVTLRCTATVYVLPEVQEALKTDTSEDIQQSDTSDPGDEGSEPSARYTSEPRITEGSDPGPRVLPENLATDQRQLEEAAASGLSDITTDVREFLDFGECTLGWHHKRTFCLTNHSKTEIRHFKWPEKKEGLMFSPQEGLLHPGCSKDVTAVFYTEEPVQLQKHTVKCKVKNFDIRAEFGPSCRAQTSSDKESQSELEGRPSWDVDLQISAAVAVEKAT